uniref:Reverse transcriptase Ty1/copia-type domain-containing protein n=1 Tax=Tanacetum cinerariifolium TaxID=118510 RepID=A0A6L2JUT8_TANCI|nr:hypothetical protein [Tanacetum cinerariifolium]
MKYVKKSIDKRALHKRDYNSRVNERQIQATEEKVDTGIALDASLVGTESSRTESKEQNTSSRLGNDAHVNDAHIRPIYNEELMAKELCKAFERLMKDKFHISSMGELTLFLGLQVKQKDDGIFISQDKYIAEILRKFGLTYGKSASTPIDTEKPLLKDLDVAYFDSDYAVASLDRKSTIGGCQFLGCRLISWQCKKQTVVATSLTEAEYVAAERYDANGIVCLPNEEIFVELARMGYEKLSTKLTFYKAFFSAHWKFLIAKRTVWNEFSYSMASVVICLATGVYTPLFDAMLVQQQVQDDVAKVKEDEDNEIAQALEITKLKQRVKKLEKNRGFKSSGFKRLMKLGTAQRVESSNDTVMDDQEDASKHEGGIAELDANEDVTLVDVDVKDNVKAEPTKVKEVLKVVTAVKLMTKVVTTAAPITTVAQVPKASAPRRRRGVVIQDPKETATSLVIVHSELEAELSANINWNDVIEQARKNMMIYLKNMAGFKMNFFKEMTYSEIRPLFEKHYNSNQAFLGRVEEEVLVKENEIKKEGSNRKGDSLEQKIAKKQIMDEEAEELKRHLQIVANDDDVYTEATPLASKNEEFGYILQLIKLVKLKKLDVQLYNDIEVHTSPSSSDKPKKHDEQAKREAKGKSHVDLSTGVRDLIDEFEEFFVNRTNRVNAAGPYDNVVSLNFEHGGKSSIVDPSQYPDDPDMPALEEIIYSDDEEDVGAEADFSNLKTSITLSLIPTTKVHKDHPVTQIIGDLSSAPQTRSMTKMVKEQAKGKGAVGSKWVFRNKKDERGIVIRNKARLVAQGHTQEEGIDYEEVFALVARIKVIRLFLAYASFIGLQALYGLHQAPRAWYETLANYLLENGFQREKIDQTLFIKKQKGDILNVQNDEDRKEAAYMLK